MTAQIHETLILDGKIIKMAFCPPLPQNHTRIIVSEADLICSTNCWRGYVGTWEIIDDSLYLVGLKGGFRLVGTDPLFADWFTGVLRIPYGKILQYVHMGFGSVYEKEGHLCINKGLLVRSREINNKDKPYDKEILWWSNMPGGENQFSGDNIASRPFDATENSFTKRTVNDPDISGYYSGDCVDGVAHGNGIARGIDEYVGEFNNGNIHGQGTYTWGEDSACSGQIFVGESVDGELVKGVWTFQKENIVKEGSFKNGMLNGVGIYRYAEGVVAEGIFMDDKLHGFGTIRIPKSLIQDPIETEQYELIGDYWVAQGIFFRVNLLSNIHNWNLYNLPLTFF
ncbi:MAG: hypothetical protein ACOYL3_25175 [Desulfuromonadaceae bacterium]